ncbi:hypothetical protein CTI14_71600, partial [Methylobacterium radiotolerans]
PGSSRAEIAVGNAFLLKAELGKATPATTTEETAYEVTAGLEPRRDRGRQRVPAEGRARQGDAGHDH